MYPEGYSTMVEPPTISRTLGRRLSTRSLSRCGNDRVEAVSVPALRSSRLRTKGLSAVESHRGDDPRLERRNRDRGRRNRSRVRWFGDEQSQPLSQRLRSGSGTSHPSKSLDAAGRAQSTQGETDVQAASRNHQSNVCEVRSRRGPKVLRGVDKIDYAVIVDAETRGAADDVGQASGRPDSGPSRVDTADR